MRDALMQLEPATVAGCEIHAIDNAPAMIAASRKLIHATQQSSTTPIVLHEANLEDHPLVNASVVAMNFTLQFVKPGARATLMRRIADALCPGGVLILSEKVCFDDPVVNQLHIEMYHTFKSRNGYSDLEISQKRTALENVLVPDTLELHQSRLLASGFGHCSVWFQCFNFASLVAIKS
jgi:tRNA (cmo5U34)-methyltransferase